MWKKWMIGCYKRAMFEQKLWKIKYLDNCSTAFFFMSTRVQIIWHGNINGIYGRCTHSFTKNEAVNLGAAVGQSVWVWLSFIKNSKK